MAQLAIKGHPTRGKEVIQLLEILGGENKYNLWGDAGYYVIEYGEILEGEYIFGDEQYTYFTLEEFESEFPYKVGDKVKAWINGYCSICNIRDMEWDSIVNEIKYKIQDYWYSTMNLQPYKEETMKEKNEKSTNHVFDTEIISFDIAQKDEYELDLQGKFEVVLKEGKYYVERIKLKYPKDYVECCECLKHNPFINNVSGYRRDTIGALQTLITYRDAYWKIAGEKMGLDKPWKPDWDNLSTPHEFIKIYKGCFIYSSRVLVFPTKEMRDAFYENFKELIEQCKELL